MIYDFKLEYDNKKKKPYYYLIDFMLVVISRRKRRANNEENQITNDKNFKLNIKKYIIRRSAFCQKKHLY